MKHCKTRLTPCEASSRCDESEIDEGSERSYRERVGSLVYAMSCTRPDLSYVVTKLSQHLSAPRKI